MFTLEKALASAWPLEAWQDLTILVAVSGGADSMALLHGLSRLKTGGAGQIGAGQIIAAHFNHRLRGAASDADAEFVQQACRELNLTCQLGIAATPLTDPGETAGLETAARAARYEFLTNTAASVGARYVVTAHTADDQTETILHRILRGTGISGLAGIPRTRRLSEATTVIRPLLGVRRSEILQYLESIGKSYREDASNAETMFTRNRIRHELLPLLRDQYSPGVDDALTRLGQLADEAQLVLQPQIQSLEDQACTTKTHYCVIQVAPCRNVSEYIVREMLMSLWREQSWPEQAMGYTQWQSLAQLLLQGKSGTRQTLPGGIDAMRDQETLTLARTN